MLRHAVFVLVLIAAAFAGGAAINGPGIAWLQRNLIGGPTIIVDGAPPTGNPSRTARRLPSANPPPLRVDFDTKPAVPTKKAPLAAAPDSAGSLPPEAPGSPAARLLQLPEPAGPDLALAAARPATRPQPTPTLEGSDQAPPLDLPPDPVASASPPAPFPAKSDPVARLASTMGGLDTSAEATSGASRDWAEVRQRLKGLGVSRYTIDGEIDGRVRFSCVIPMDGLRAVGHHFEAEGDDEFQAIEATIRRITLWRATEPGRTDP